MPSLWRRILNLRRKKRGRGGGPVIAEHSQMIWFCWGRLDCKSLPWWYAAPLGFTYLYYFHRLVFKRTFVLDLNLKEFKIKAEKLTLYFWRAKKMHVWMAESQTNISPSLNFAGLGNQNNETKWRSYTRAHMWPFFFFIPLTLLFPLAADGPGDRFIIGESQAGEQVCNHVDIQTRLLFLTHKKTPTQCVLCMSMKSFAFCASAHTVTKSSFFMGSRSSSKQSSEFLQNMSTSVRSADVLLESVGEPLF